MMKIWIPMAALAGLTGFVLTQGLPGEPATAQGAQSTASTVTQPVAVTSAGPVVAELFTSQGCSSCPPADAVAARLARDPAILVISRPVTYWDRLGWKDSLGREANTRLQRQYGDTAFGGANIYTPQLVIDGRTQGVGSQEVNIRKLIARAATARKASGVAVRVTPTAGGGRNVSLDGTTEADAEVILVALSKSETVSIGRGENGGRKVSYTNVVINETAIGRWKGGRQAMMVRSNQLSTPGADRHALIVRQGAGGPVIGSAVI